MTTASVTGQPHADGDGESVTSRSEMGVRAVGAALRRARGRLSQQAAAERWHVPLATMAALEQGVVRDYQAQTLAQFDEMLGTRTLDLYERPDEVPPPTSMEDVTRAFLEASDDFAENVARRLAVTYRTGPMTASSFAEVAELWEKMPTGVRLALTLLMHDIAELSGIRDD